MLVPIVKTSLHTDVLKSNYSHFILIFFYYLYV